MKRILFVDDEPYVLEGLRTLLRKQRKIWDMWFATSGAEALQILASGDVFDVVVSDMRMPVMSGADLLRTVQRDYPSAVRIVLSGQTEQEVARRIVHVAHQFLSKPCEGSHVQETIERACNLQTLLEHPALRQIVGQIGQLPIKPAAYSRLVATLEDPQSSLSDAAAVIETDIGSTTKVLQIVNSSFFGSPKRITSVGTALTHLGLEMVKAVVLAEEMRSSPEQLAPPPGFDVAAVQEHGLGSARLARCLLTDRTAAEDAFSAAMLQDVGLLVLAGRMPSAFSEIVEHAGRTGASLAAAEREKLGVTHAEIGAYLLGIWGLPYSVVEAVAYHHEPQRAGSTSPDVVCAVHVASALADESLPPGTDRPLNSSVKLDEAYLDKLGLLPKLQEWRALARTASSDSPLRSR